MPEPIRGIAERERESKLQSKPRSNQSQRGEKTIDTSRNNNRNLEPIRTEETRKLKTRPKKQSKPRINERHSGQITLRKSLNYNQNPKKPKPERREMVDKSQNNNQSQNQTGAQGREKQEPKLQSKPRTNQSQRGKITVDKSQNNKQKPEPICREMDFLVTYWHFM